MQGELTMDAAQIYQRSATMRRSWRRLLAAADAVTGCSQQVVDEAVAAYGDGLVHKARVVRNGVDLEAVRSAQPERRDRPYVLGIGRFVPQKGLDVLIDAFSRIADDHPELDLLLAGDGPMRAELEAQAAAGRHADRIAFLGAVPSARAFSLYAGAAAFVLASRHEPQGIVVIEAMAAGAPVVATRVGGVPETVRHGENGLLVAGDDVTAMAVGLRELLGDPNAAGRRVARAARDVDAYSWRQITDQYLDCYDDAMTSAAARRKVRPGA
jgi:glycosyltransferase involved in cell wall biosynthesis